MFPLFAFFLIPLYFPTGRPPAGRWNWIMKWTIGMWLTGALVGGVFSPDVGPGDGRWAMPNPIGLPFLGRVEDPFFNLWPIGIMVIVVGSAASLFVRYRRAGPEVRQQIKWLLVAAGLTMAFFVPFFFLSSGDSHSAWLDLGFDLVVVANPLAIAIAIFRYRVWDLDVVVNRALVYGPLTTLLAGIFAMLISVTSVLAKEIFGAQSQAMGAAISAVVVAVIFQPMRDWVQAFVDKRFYPQKRNLDTGLVEVQPEYWAFINQQKLLQIAQAHVRRTLGVTYTAFYLATDGSDFELALPGGGGEAEPARVGPTEKQASELRRRWVVESEGGGPAVGFAPVHIDRGEEIEVLGLLAVGARSNGRGYSGDDLRALADLGGKIGLALNAIQLGEETAKDPPKELAGSPAALHAAGAVE